MTIKQKERARRYLSFSVFWWALRNRRSIFHIHDPDLLWAVPLLRMAGCQCIYDVHDDYQASIETRLQGRHATLRFVPRIWWAFEKLFASFCSAVIVADRHLESKFAWKNPIVLGNFPRFGFSQPATPSKQTTFNLLYVGGVSRERGVGVVLKALALLEHEDLRFHVIGNCKDPQLLEELKADSRVILHGRVDWTELGPYYERSHVGLALYQPLPSFLYYPGENAVKILEYMAAGIPVVTSDFPGLRKFVVGNGTGLVIDPTSAEQLAEALDTLYREDELRSGLGAKGRKLFEEEYNWENHEHKLIALYEQVMAQ